MTKLANMTESRTCSTCGESFTARWLGRVVRCPACRRERRNRNTASQYRLAKTCFCGKTVLIDGFGYQTGWTCPRYCHLPVEQRPQVRVP